MQQWLPAAAERQGLALLHAAGTQRMAGPASMGGYHPQLGALLQVAGEAAEARRSSGAALWTAGSTPAVLILAATLPLDPWLVVAAHEGLSLYRSTATFHDTLWQLRADLARHPLATDTLHAGLIEVLGLGVLLTGPSGSGKSELALELVSRGHRLVADDVVDLSRPAPGCLLGRSPGPLAGFIEVRGLGILDLRAAYGTASVLPAARIDLCLQLDPADTAPTADERLHGRRDVLSLLGIDIPRIVLPSRLRHNAAMVEAACRDHWLRHAGYTAAQVLIDAQARRAAGLQA